MTAKGIRKVSAKGLTKMILNNEDLFILDVRNASDFSDWKIEGINVEIINIPYFDLLDVISPALDKIPTGRPVVVVCAKEGSSIFVAEQLAEAGLNRVSYLEGGMKSWSEHLEPVKVADLSGGGKLYQFVRIGKGCLSYMVLSNGEAAIIDTSRMIDQYEQFMQENSVKLVHTIDTHLHADHISGGRALAQIHAASYHLPPKDAKEVTFEFEELAEGKDILVGQETIKVQPIYTPGHTIGSTSFIIDNKYLLTGDILFIESIGRPDLAGLAEDWAGDLRDTLYSRYKALPEELIVLPAHFGKITELGKGGLVSGRLGTLYSENPGLHIEDESEFRRTVTENMPPQPNSYHEIRQANRGKITPNKEKQREMELGPNRCAVHDK